MVDTQEGRVRALGTRFSVSQQADYSQVAVFADKVEIQPTCPLSYRTRFRIGLKCCRVKLTGLSD